MTVRPPRQFSETLQDPLAAALEHEVMAEKAGTLGRLTRNLEKCLDRLASADNDDDYRVIVAEAGEALWYVMIQRELCGLRQHKAFFDHMGVPIPIRLAMGPNCKNRKEPT